MPGTDIALLSAEEMLGLYARQALSPVEVLQAVTERVARLNPRINAFVAMNPGALAAAGESAARWRAGRPLGLLDGVPVTVKDLVDIAGFPTRRGSRLTDPAPVADDAPMVVGLKAAGAVILGKTCTTEFGWKSPGDCPLTRNHAQSVEHRVQHGGFIVGRRRGGGGRVRAVACRHRCRWLDPDPSRLVRAGRAEAELRARAAMAGRRVCHRFVRRPDDAHGARRRADAVGDGTV